MAAIALSTGGRASQGLRRRLVPFTYDEIAASIDEAQWKADFGMTIHEFNAIHAALKLPVVIKTNVRDKVDSKTALLMVMGFLRGRMLNSLEGQYQWSASRISRIHRATVDIIVREWSHLLDVTSTRHHLLSRERLTTYAQAIESKTRLGLFWGAVDGTLRPISRPQTFQHAVYNGWKHMHALKWQFIVTPDGLIFLYGPEDGARHDYVVWCNSGVSNWARTHAFDTAGNELCLYGDKGYAKSFGLITPFRGQPEEMPPERNRFNQIMSA